MEHRPSPGKLAVGKRYINTKNNQSLTLLYIGPLPPSNPSERGSSSSTTQWLGVEYDDPEFGKGHSGTYEGLQIFQTRQEGAGAFIKLRTGNEFVEGKTFIDAIKGRYGYGCGLESDGHGHAIGDTGVVELCDRSGSSWDGGGYEAIEEFGEVEADWAGE
jgi:hypothetical protein